MLAQHISYVGQDDDYLVTRNCVIWHNGNTNDEVILSETIAETEPNLQLHEIQIIETWESHKLTPEPSGNSTTDILMDVLELYPSDEPLQEV